MSAEWLTGAPNFFIAGTGTGVGKTFVTALLVRSLRRAGIDSVGMKPICCGDRADAEDLYEASGKSATLNAINPIWLRTPVAPYTASIIEERMIDLDQVRESFAALRRAHPSVLVEGVGGWLVPIRRDYSAADMAADFGLPVVVVVRNQLGALNHALLTVESIQRRGLSCAGLILNNAEPDDDIAARTNASVLEDLLEVPVLAQVSLGQQWLELVSAR